MSRRDSDASPPMEEHIVHPATKAYYRLRCLEVAVKTFDPDSSINIIELIDVSRSLFSYCETGLVPRFE